MTGMILDGILMLLLVAALGYGVRLERKLAALRAGQLAFASAVTDLNTAAGRAEAALASLRASGQETDLLHDRIIKAREVKAQLETLIARGGEYVPARAPEAPRAVAPAPAPRPAPVAPPVSEEEARAARMQALAERIQGMAAPARPAAASNVHAILGALTANQSAKQSLNQARRSLDDDLFAA
ncbi:DUF6468 domain-containing protein [Brevundimonas sp.]|uniref:DUF6468 domain-containing protein n=1 Tax=Brevundimonas sp. TaxID=1871086 RepID=UPI003F72EBE3